MVVFAGNHGVTAKGVSRFLQKLPGNGCKLDAGGAAINQLCKLQNAELAGSPWILIPPRQTSLKHRP